MPASLLTHLEGKIPLYLHEHVAVLHRSSQAALRLAPFLSEGLAAGDTCAFLGVPPFQAEMLACLRALVPNLDARLKQKVLRVFEGSADYRALREWTERIFSDAERNRVPAIRWLEDGIWPKHAGFPLPQFFEFHALLNYQVKTYPSAVICQYDVEQIEVRHLFCAIAVHRHLVVEDTLVRDNPFYIPAEKFIPLSLEERERDLLQLFREVGFDLQKLLVAVVGYGKLQQPRAQDR